MDRLGLIRRKISFHEIPIRIEYYSTEKGVTPTNLDKMAAYPMKYCSKNIFKDANPRDLRSLWKRCYRNCC